MRELPYDAFLLFTFVISFLQKSTLWIPNTRRWTSYEWHDEMYIIIACNDNADQNEQAYSYVYKVVNDQLHEFQKLPTKRAFGVTAIDADGHFYVIFAYMYGIASDVFRFESTRFVKHSSIPVIGSDIQSFKIGKTVYLAVVGRSIFAMFFCSHGHPSTQKT